MFEDYHMTSFDTPEAKAAAAALPVGDRQRLVESMLLATPTFERTARFLKSQHMPITGGHHLRGRICGILGPSRVGKSWAVKAYCASLGQVDTANAIIPRAAYVDCKKGWSALAFAQGIADAANVPRKGRASAAVILELVTNDVAGHGVELIVIDDAQWVFASATACDIVKGFIIGLAERRTCNIVLVGTEPIDLVVRSEESMVGRGMFPTHRLEPSDWRNGGDMGEFHLALDMIDDMLPFARRSGLTDPWTAAHLYHFASGKLGLAMEVIQAASYIAIEEGDASVSVARLREAAQPLRRRGDPWEPFGSSIDLDKPGTAESRYDEEDGEAERDIEVRLEKKRTPKREPGPREPIPRRQKER